MAAVGSCSAVSGMVWLRALGDHHRVGAASESVACPILAAGGQFGELLMTPYRELCGVLMIDCI